MPYALPDPSAPRPTSSTGSTLGLTQTEAEVLRDTADVQQSAVGQTIGQLRGPIQAAADAKAEAAVADVAATPEYKSLAAAGFACRAPWFTRGAAIRAAANDRFQSAAGRDDVRKKADAALTGAIQGIAQRALSDQGDALLARFPGAKFPVVSPDVAGMASLVVVTAGQQLPESFLAEGADVLRRAADPATPAAEQVKLNQLLNSAYAPVTERFAGAPPRYWFRWSPLAADLAALMRTHLSTVLGRAHYQAAVDAVETFRFQFTSLVQIMQQNGSWDDLLAKKAGPAFAWPYRGQGIDPAGPGWGS